jgi:hypothetical protein
MNTCGLVLRFGVVLNAHDNYLLGQWPILPGTNGLKRALEVVFSRSIF